MIQQENAQRAVEKRDWDLCLNGNPDDAMSLIELPLLVAFVFGAVDPHPQVDIPTESR